MEPRKIPTIFGLLLVAAIVAVFIFVFDNLTRGSTSAKASAEPRSVTFTNITDSSFTVTWETGDAASGLTQVKDTRGKTMTFYDDRDAFTASSKKTLNKYLAHSATATNLSANTRYEIQLISEGKTYGDDKTPYTIITAPTTSIAPDGYEPAYGTVVTAANLPAEGALVFVTLEGGQQLSSLVNASGSWIIPLNDVRTSDLSQYVAKVERKTELIKVAINGEEANAVTDTLNDSPVPIMTLGKSYDFRKLQAKLPQSLAQGTPLEQPAVLGVQTKQGYSVALVQPADGAALATNLPLIQGRGIPGKLVSVVLGITNPLAGSTTVKSDGTWNFTPPARLGEGNQSVTITTVDGAGKPVATTHTFTILKSGSQVLGEATPSATLAPTATPIATPTAQPIPTSGTTLPTLLLLIFGLGLLTTGAVVFIR